MHFPKIHIFEMAVDTETDQFFFVFAFIYSHIHTRITKKSSLLKCTCSYILNNLPRARGKLIL